MGGIDLHHAVTLLGTMIDTSFKAGNVALMMTVTGRTYVDGFNISMPQAKVRVILFMSFTGFI